MTQGKKNGKIEAPLWNSVKCMAKNYVDMSCAFASVQCSVLGSVQFTKKYIPYLSRNNFPQTFTSRPWK